MYLEPKEQDRLLELAEKEGWSRHRLREEVHRRIQPIDIQGDKCVLCGEPVVVASRKDILIQLNNATCYELKDLAGAYKEAFKVYDVFIAHSMICKG